MFLIGLAITDEAQKLWYVFDGVMVGDVKEDDEGGSSPDNMGHGLLVPLLSTAVPEVDVYFSEAVLKAVMLKVEPYCS